MNKQTKLIIGCILFLLLLINWGGSTWSTLQEVLYSSYCGIESKRQDGQVQIASIKLDDYSPILHEGDELLGIKELPHHKPTSWLNGRLPVSPGREITLIVKCHSAVYEVPVTTEPVPFSTWFYSTANILTPLVFILTGLIVLLLRQDDQQAWLLALMLGTFTGLFNSSLSDLPFWILIIIAITRVFGLMFLPIFFKFFLIFPEPSPLLQRWPKIERWLFIPFFLFTIPLFSLGRVSQFFPKFVDPIFSVVPDTFLRTVNVFGLTTVICLLVGGLVSLGLNYRVASKEGRRKLHIIVVGCGAGFINLLLVVVIELFGQQGRLSSLNQGLQYLAVFTLPLIPISFAYAIIKHQVIPVSLIIRRSIRYVLVSRGAILLEIALFIFLITVFLSFFFSQLFEVYRPKSIQTLGMIIGIISAGVGIISWNYTRRLHEKYLAPIIDRKFFRQSYDSHQIISGLTESLRSTAELPKLLEEVATKLQSALQLESVTILLVNEQTGIYQSSYRCEYNRQTNQCLSAECNFRLSSADTVATYLRSANKPIELHEIPVSELEEATLKQMKAALLLPLIGKDKMLGIIVLGKRLGELPFSREDQGLLMSVANPAALAIENSNLVHRMIEEARRREEIEAENEARAKELEEARQLQLSMLPKKIPQLPHLEIAAYMKPATEVGGDYYDFHLTKQGTLTIAVGDATGHGLKAGTVVTAAKSLFRTFALEAELAPIMSQSSRVLKEMNLRPLFMALTIARVEGYKLKISSAGMPPMLIYRALTNSIEEVWIKALPLGSVINYEWKQRELTLDPGDVILMMSDGFPEWFNNSGEILGYAKAHEVLSKVAGLSPQAIIESFIKVGDQWADGHPQVDDVTFVVLKVK